MEGDLRTPATVGVDHWRAGELGSGIAAVDIVSVLTATCGAHPTVPAILFEDGVSISRQELRETVERFAGYLSSRIAPGERVAIVLENRIEFMIAWLAVVAAGGVLVSINPRSQRHDAGHVLEDSGAVLAIVSDATRPVIDTTQTEPLNLREVLVVAADEPHGLDRFADEARLNLAQVRMDHSQPTNVYYTSGTTGRPKGCQLAHGYWLRFLDLWLRLYGMGAEDRILGCVPFFYGDAPWQFLLSLHVGSTWIPMRRFSVSRFWNVVKTFEVTQIFSLASMPALLLKAAPERAERDHAVRFGVHVGIPRSIHRQMVDRWGFPWMEAYGLTETGLVIGMPPLLAEQMTGSGSIGTPCPEVRVRLVTENGEEAAIDALGELVVSAPGLMLGYLNRPDATAETLRDGWLHTGDLARRDADGFLYFVSRKKDIIRRNGENISANEVEEVLRSHPAVRDAAVIALPDEVRGEEVEAFIEALPEAPSRGELCRALTEFCRGRLAPHKVPRYFALREEPMPRTPSMRVNKGLLRSLGEASTTPAWDRERELGW